MKKHEPITVTLMTKPPRAVSAFATAHSAFAVTPYGGDPESRYWTVTHIPTGSAVVKGVGKTLAFKLAGALGGLIDWNTSDADLLASRFRNLPQSWQYWARSCGN